MSEQVSKTLEITLKDGLVKVKLLPDLGPKLPVAAVENNGKQVVSDDSSATVTVVAIAAVPDVSWLPPVFTPGRLIAAVPSNDTPPIFLAVAKAVAVSAFPSNAPSNLVASISPEAFIIITGVSLFVLNLI